MPEESPGRDAAQRIIRKKKQRGDDFAALPVP
jgi:hypothetical protein